MAGELGNLSTLSAVRTGVRGEGCEINYRTAPLAKAGRAGVTVISHPTQGEALVSRRHRLLCGLAASALLLTGCSGSQDPGGAPARTPATPTEASDPAVSSKPLIQGLDVCSLATPGQVRQAAGQVGEPTSRSLTRIEGYDGLVDQCGFGVSFDSFTLLVGVGLAPATRKDLAGLPGRPVGGIGDAARAADQASSTTVSFLKGSTLVQVRAVKGPGGTSRAGQVAAVARRIAVSVPGEPPDSDVQTEGKCVDVDPQAVERVLGAPSGVARSLLYKDQSAVCSWATGVRNPRTVSVSVYTNRQAGPFLADQKGYEPTRKVPGVTGDAFTIPGTAYVVAEDGQAVAVTGTFPPRAAADKPLPVTPQLAALLTSGAALLQ
jgi:hypothetical protein